MTDNTTGLFWLGSVGHSYIFKSKIKGWLKPLRNGAFTWGLLTYMPSELHFMGTWQNSNFKTSLQTLLGLSTAVLIGLAVHSASVWAVLFGRFNSYSGILRTHFGQQVSPFKGSRIYKNLKHAKLWPIRWILYSQWKYHSSVIVCAGAGAPSLCSEVKKKWDEWLFFVCLCSLCTW